MLADQREWSTRRPPVRRSWVMGGAAVFTAVITAGCFGLDDPTTIEASQVLSIDIAPDTASATGAARLPIRVTLVGDTPLGTEVTLSTDGGTFVGAPSASPSELKIKAPSRTLDAVLLAGLDPKIATVIATAGGFSVRDTVRLAPALPQVVELTTDIARAPANGQSVITASVRALRLMPEETVSRRSRILFSVSRDGAPAPELSGSSETDAAGVATRPLVSRVPGVYRIVAQSGSLADTVLVEFTAP